MVSHLVPFLAIIGYLVYPKQLQINKSLLLVLSIIHNGLLIVFSVYSCISLSHLLYHEGINFQSSYYFQNQEFDTIIYLFYLSKYYEFLDTFLLYLNGKTPIFLQKYHHIGAVMCWHLFYVYKVDAIWIATLLNSFVHTIMYSYYMGCLLKIKQVKVIKKYITFLQLCQLIPQPLSLYLYRTTEPNYTIIVVFTFYCIGLIMLFASFYYTTYIKIKGI